MYLHVKDKEVLAGMLCKLLVVLAEQVTGVVLKRHVL